MRISCFTFISHLSNPTWRQRKACVSHFNRWHLVRRCSARLRPDGRFGREVRQLLVLVLLLLRSGVRGRAREWRRSQTGRQRGKAGRHETGERGREIWKHRAEVLSWYSRMSGASWFTNGLLRYFCSLVNWKQNVLKLTTFNLPKTAISLPQARFWSLSRVPCLQDRFLPLATKKQIYKLREKRRNLVA